MTIVIMTIPVETQRRFITKKTSIRRRLDFLKTLKRHRVSTGEILCGLDDR